MKVAGCILAGGRSSRFGSDKALIEWKGKTLLAHAIERLRPQVDADCHQHEQPGAGLPGHRTSAVPGSDSLRSKARSPVFWRV